ncbi:isochorismatase domain-containing protein 2 isoform X1 [Monodelphis domestica]|uniref:isochorismatase domain-containing protein 2 isoform X1 n=1 Tax=Monodelphis domestica TaxID=13616 RepID=UPI0024E1AEE7|nr:isochorismatase domain-containing protein 2 isoform X1 [Monodelphis domestica]
MAAARLALGRVLPGSSVLFLCDMQEKFRGTVSFFPQIVAVSARMLQVARMLDIPTVLTEQYPQGLGPTVPELGAQGLRAVPKTSFSMMVPEVERLLKARPGLRSVLLCGIEAQACILCTALDLLERGLEVHVVADACSSRRMCLAHSWCLIGVGGILKEFRQTPTPSAGSPLRAYNHWLRGRKESASTPPPSSQVDRLLALSRMRQSGVFLTTSESLILQLLRDAAHPHFKEVQKFLRDPAPDTGLLGLFQGKNPLFS